MTKTILFDIETTRIIDNFGVMQIPEKVHLITAMNDETGEEYVFGPDWDNLTDGVRFLETADTLVAHNGQGFDVPVLRHHFGFEPTGRVWDSLILCRLFYSNIKEAVDFGLYERGKKLPNDSPVKFTGDLIGSHSLAAWGLRLGLPKGDFGQSTKTKKGEVPNDPWAQWSQEMQEYAVQDVRVLAKLWREKLKPRMMDDRKRFAELKRKRAERGKPVSDALANPANIWNIEHYLHELMDDLKKQGIKFDVERAERLAAELSGIAGELEKELQTTFPPRFEPIKWERRVWTDEETHTKNKYNGLQRQYPKNDVYHNYWNFHEGYHREMFGAEFTYKKPKRSKTPNENGVCETVEGPFVKCHWKEFNPGSRIQIVRRLLELGWIPDEFTDAENPSANENELNKIIDQYPAAKSIAEYLLVQKRLGQLKSGDNAWLNKVDENGFIHPTISPCSTVTFRATHSSPNISQVPSVKKAKDGKTPLKGRDGKWGWDCRELFTVPEGWTMVGSDLAGIELRCWAHYLALYDKGSMINTVLNEDIHENNRKVLGFNDRRDAKSFLYALLYGAGDEKLGYIIVPRSSIDDQKKEGRKARARFMNGVNGVLQLDNWLRDGVKRGWVLGIDGRRCPVRKQHAALNTLLQAAGAIVSKYWIVEIFRMLDEHGLRFGYDGDYSLMIYSHDEVDFAVKAEHVDIVKHACLEGARIAGERLGMRIPITSDVMIGTNWAECH